MAIPISYSEKLGYRIEYSIFIKLDNATQQTEWLKPPAFLAFGTSTLTRLILRTSSIAELIIHGLILSFAPSLENRKHGWNLLKRVPNQGLNLLAIIPGVLTSPIIIIFEPKFYILINVENIKINCSHLEAGTIGTQNHKVDLKMTKGRVKKKLIEWQERNED